MTLKHVRQKETLSWRQETFIQVMHWMVIVSFPLYIRVKGKICLFNFGVYSPFKIFFFPLKRLPQGPVLPSVINVEEDF